jgi:hypothetical protein
MLLDSRSIESVTDTNEKKGTSDHARIVTKARLIDSILCLNFIKHRYMLLIRIILSVYSQNFLVTIVKIRGLMIPYYLKYMSVKRRCRKTGIKCLSIRI